MTIKLLLTGGTIDKHYNELNGDLGFTETHIDEILQQARCQVDLSIQQVMLKDSLQMQDEDREQVLNACLASDENQIIITHGTDTMVETAEVLGKQLTDKTIVLLGAMIPYILKKSDALFNFGCAVSAVQCLAAGVYITMNGKIFPWNDIKKNREKGLFENT